MHRSRQNTEITFTFPQDGRTMGIWVCQFQNEEQNFFSQIMASMVPSSAKTLEKIIEVFLALIQDDIWTP